MACGMLGSKEPGNRTEKKETWTASWPRLDGPCIVTCSSPAVSSVCLVQCICWYLSNMGGAGAAPESIVVQFTGIES